jgi:hypothetical protein
MSAKKLERKKKNLRKLNACAKKPNVFAESMKLGENTSAGVAKKSITNFKKEKDSADTTNKSRKGVIKNSNDESVNRTGTNDSNISNSNNANNNITVTLVEHAPLLLLDATNLKALSRHWREDIQHQIQDRLHSPF